MDFKTRLLLSAIIRYMETDRRTAGHKGRDMEYKKIKRKKRRRRNAVWLTLGVWLARLLFVAALLFGIRGLWVTFAPSSEQRWEAYNITLPEEHTQTEVMEKLVELAEDNPKIQKICQDTSLYPEALLAALVNNPEMADFVLGYPKSDGSTGKLSLSERYEDHPLFLQWDKRWGYAPYGEDCIGLSGCGPTCLSMVLFYLTGDASLTPDAVATFSTKNGYYVEGTGTAWALMEDLPKRYGISVKEVSASQEAMEAALDRGELLICAMGKGYFTTQGHFIVLYGYDKDGFFVNDPNSMARSKIKWKFSDIQYQMRKIWAYC